MPQNNKSCKFTLIELVVGVTIILLAAGVAVVRIGRTPTAATLERSVRELERLFAQTSYLASTHGKPVGLVYLPEARQFRIREVSDEPVTGNREYLLNRTYILTLPAAMTVEFSGDRRSGDPVEYQCWPDGAAVGPMLTLKLSESLVCLTPSPLTGQLLKTDTSLRRR